MMPFLLQIAQTIDASEVGIPEAGGDAIITTVLNLFYFVTGLVAVIVIIVAGMRYATSSGDAGKITASKNQILYAVVGLVIVASAFTITNFIIGRF